MQKDFVVYYKDDKEVVSVLYNVEDEPKYLINLECNAVVISHDDYKITNDNGVARFVNLNENIIYLDDYRGRYEE